MRSYLTKEMRVTVRMVRFPVEQHEHLLKTVKKIVCSCFNLKFKLLRELVLWLLHSIKHTVSIPLMESMMFIDHQFRQLVANHFDIKGITHL